MYIPTVRSLILVYREGAADELEPCELAVRIGSGLDGIGPNRFAHWLRRRPSTLAIVTSATSDAGWAAALASDYLAVQRGARLDSLEDPAVMAAAAWRIERRVVEAILRAPLEAGEILELGLADALVEAERDPLEWAREWVGARSASALASAALLLRNRHGGTVLERSEFAWLFSTGEPQIGLARFLGKLPLDFSDKTDWEMR